MGTGTSWLMVALACACAAAGWLGVALVRARRLHRKALEDRGWLLERERASAAGAAVDAERARIARELHDIVSHNVSLMVIQAGAAREVLASMPEETETALRVVEEAGRSAMTELRHLLGVLAPSQSGEDDPDGTGDRTELSPTPGLSRLSSLIDRFAFAGLPVEVRVSGEPRPLPAGIDVTAYRVVREALTNVLKHGGGAETEVMVRYADRSLRVEVLNSGPSVLSGGGRAAGERDTDHRDTDHRDGEGRGLLGLKERVALYGGDLDARRRLGGGYRVRARIPLDRP